MNNRRRRDDMLRLSVVIAVAGVVVFGVCSYWPWTRTITITTGTAYGLTIGATQAETRAAVAAGLAAGRFSSLEPLAPGSWFVGIAGCNCWLELHFANGRLASIEARRHYGPTE